MGSFEQWWLVLSLFFLRACPYRLIIRDLCLCAERPLQTGLMVVVVPFCVLRGGTEVDTTTFTVELSERSRNQVYVGISVRDSEILESEDGMEHTLS